MTGVKFGSNPWGGKWRADRICPSRGAIDYVPSTTPIPDRSKSSFGRGSLPARSVKSSLSTVTIWETFATESFGRPVRRAEKRAFPGAPPHLRLLVSGTQTVVARRLRFSASHCTTTTGLPKPGPDPVGAGRSAHQISPWEITIRFALELDVLQRKRTRPSQCPTRHRPYSSPRSRCPACGGRDTP